MTDQEPPPNANAEVARLFAEISDILELKGEQPYRYNAYRTAARSVGNARERLDVLFQQGRLRELYGIGSALEAKIVEYLTTGQMEFYDRQRRDFPPALASLLQVPGLGPVKARALYQELGVSTTAELEEAARSGRLKDVAGFGEQGVQALLENLARVKQRSERDLISNGWLTAVEIQEALGNPTDEDRIAVVGSVRRMADSIGGLDLVAARDEGEGAERLIEGLVNLPNIVQVVEREADHARIRLYGNAEKVVLRGQAGRSSSWASAWMADRSSLPVRTGPRASGTVERGSHFCSCSGMLGRSAQQRSVTMYDAR